MDYAIGEILVENCNGGRCLEKTLPSGRSVSLGPVRQALIQRTPSVVIGPTLPDEVVHPRLGVRGVEVDFGNRSVPDARQIGLAVRAPRRGCSQIGLAVGFAWN